MRQQILNLMLQGSDIKRTSRRTVLLKGSDIKEDIERTVLRKGRSTRAIQQHLIGNAVEIIDIMKLKIQMHGVGTYLQALTKKSVM